MAKLSTVLVVQYTYGFTWPDEKLARFESLLERGGSTPWTVEEEREYVVLRNELEALAHAAIRNTPPTDSDRVSGEVWSNEAVGDDLHRPLIDWDY